MAEDHNNRLPSDNAPESEKPAQPEESNREERKRQLDREVRQISVKAALCLTKANNDRDQLSKKKNILEAIGTLRQAILAPDGTLDMEKVEALRAQIVGTTDGRRHFFLEWVIANSEINITIENFDEVMRDRPRSANSQKPYLERYKEFVSEWSTIIDIADPGLRLARLEVLLAKINTLISRIGVLAQVGYMVVLQPEFVVLQDAVRRHREGCLEVVRGELKAVGDRAVKDEEDRALIQTMIDLLKNSGDEDNKFGVHSNN